MGSIWRTLSCIIVISVSGCTVADTPPADEPELSSAALHVDSLGRVEVTRHARSFQFTTLEPRLPAGIAGGSEAIFVGLPLEGRVLVLSRATGLPIAELPQPPGGFILPVVIHAIGPSSIAVLDSGGFPSPGTIDVSPTLYEYKYAFARGNFSAQLARSVSFASVRIGFSEDFVSLGSGQYLVTDSVYGAIWRVTAGGSIQPGIVPKSYEPQDAIPQLVFCPTMPEVTVGGLPFLFTGSTIPGVAGIAEREGTVYFYSSCAAALYKFPFAALFDNRQPWQRAADIRFIAGKSPNVQVEEVLQMQWNPFDPHDRYLYAADALQLQLIRIDPRNGARTVLGRDPYLYNFPSGLGFLPAKFPSKTPLLLVLSNQQHRDPLLNDAISEEVLQLPYVITGVQLCD